MDNRLKLHNLLLEINNGKNVYYQPPSTMEYTAIRYSKQKPKTNRADDKLYKKTNRWQIIVISRIPDDPVLEKISELPMCSFDNHYVSDNLHHDVFTLYY